MKTDDMPSSKIQINNENHQSKISDNSPRLLDLVLSDMEEHHQTPDDVLYVGDMEGHRADWKTFEKYAKRVDISKPLQKAYLDQLFVMYLEDGREMECPISELLEEAV